MSLKDLDDEDEEPGFFARYRILLIIGVLLIGAGIWFGPSLFKKSAKPAKAQEFSMVRIVPPPPPTPPPPPPPPPPKAEDREPPKEEMVAQEAVQEDEPPPEQAPPDEPPPGEDLATSIAGDGPPDGFGLGVGNGGGGRGGSGMGGTGRRGGGSKFGWYAAQVQTRIAEALRSNPKTSRADLRIEARIWPDETGRVTRASLARSTGDASMDETIQNDVLTGLRLSQPPPADMPLPIVLRLTIRRPN